MQEDLRVQEDLGYKCKLPTSSHYCSTMSGLGGFQIAAERELIWLENLSTNGTHPGFSLPHFFVLLTKLSKI